jgi:hypothetical protein
VRKRKNGKEGKSYQWLAIWTTQMSNLINTTKRMAWMSSSDNYGVKSVCNSPRDCATMGASMLLRIDKWGRSRRAWLGECACDSSCGLRYLW